MSSMLVLANCEPFAIGGRRACYVHPYDQKRCIKVILGDKRPTQLRRSHPWWKRLHHEAYYDENIQDLKIYRHLSSRHGAAIHRHLPQVFGLVETDLGVGLDVELIRDADGRISLSGKGYIIEQGLTGAFREPMDALEAFLLRYRIQFRDPFPHNLAVQIGQDDTLRLFIVDGLARKSRIPFDRLPRVIAEPRIHKKMHRLLQGLKRTDNNRRAGVTPKNKGLLLKR